MNDEEKELKKEAWKEAMREFLDEEKKRTFESIGRYLVNLISIMLVGAMVWFMIHVEKIKGP